MIIRKNNVCFVAEASNGSENRFRYAVAGAGGQLISCQNKNDQIHLQKMTLNLCILKESLHYFAEVSLDHWSY